MLHNEIGKGKVNFFSKTRNGGHIFLGYKEITFTFESGVNFMKCFCEGLRKTMIYNRKGNIAEYEWTGTIAVCDIIQDFSGKYINQFPIAVEDWENYGLEK